MPYIGATLCVLDMISDIIVILKYRHSGYFGFATALFATICSNLSVQAFLTYLQNRKKIMLTQFKELVYLFTLVSLGVHAHRVSTGQEHFTDFFSPQMMMMLWLQDV